MLDSERNKKIYEYSLAYLKAISPVDDLDRYFLGDSNNPQDLKAVYRELIRVAQDYQSMPNIIKFIEREDIIRDILHDYDFAYISSFDPSELYYRFRSEFNITTKDSKLNSWYKWSCSVVDAAAYVNSFDSIDEFKSFVDSFRLNEERCTELSKLIATKIRGIGFSLASNALKELGFYEYCKPDVHLMDICEELGLSERSEIGVFKTITQIAKDNGVEPYKVDKILWLICSGNFYKDGIKIGSHKKELISYLSKRLAN